jgi:predicted regulator of Ras-like GTPase activity (Roadblock/LC7/MglB family)
MSDSYNRSERLDRAIADLLGQAPEVEAAAVVSFDGLPMASALPATMDEDRVAAMSAALLSLGERAAEGLGRGGLNQVYIEGDQGTVFLVSADDEAVLVAVASRGAKVGMMLYEVRRAAASVADVLRAEFVAPVPDEAPADVVAETGAWPAVAAAEPVDEWSTPVQPVAEDVDQYAPYAPVTSDTAWAAPQPTSSAPAADAQAWS